MNKEELEGLLIDYIDGKLDAEARARVEKEIATKEETRLIFDQLREVINAMDQSKQIEPGSNLKASFDKILQTEIDRQKGGRTISFQPLLYRIAAGLALVMAGIAVGYWINKNQEREADMMALKKEVQATKQMMLIMMDNQQSASQRIIGTTVAYNLEKPDDQIVNALVKSMNEDPNTNVRLAALEALIKFNGEPAVRLKLIESLAIQKDPAVQITLIQFLVRMKVKEVVNELQHIVDDAHTIKAVKDEALSGLLKLS